MEFESILRLGWVEQEFILGYSVSKSLFRHCLQGLTILRLGTIPSNAVPEGEPQKARNSLLLSKSFASAKMQDALNEVLEEQLHPQTVPSI